MFMYVVGGFLGEKTVELSKFDKISRFQSISFELSISQDFDIQFRAFELSIDLTADWLCWRGGESGTKDGVSLESELGRYTHTYMCIYIYIYV